MRNGWNPILKYEIHKRECEFVESIASCLEHVADNATSASRRNDHIIDSGFTAAGGRAGYALFYCYKYLMDRDKCTLRRCNRALTQAAEAVSTYKFAPSLFGGFTGVAWVIERVCSVLGRKKVVRFQDMRTLNDQIDEFLLQLLHSFNRDFDYDLIRGLVGIGVYFMERLPRMKAYTGLEEIVRQLSQRAESSETGICWFTPPDLIPSSQINAYPNGCYNLGLAHGIPGVIALLSHVYSAGILRRETERLLRGSLSWVFHQRLPDTEPSSFDYSRSQTSQPSSARLAWCYGDAGVSAALVAGANSLNDSALRDTALKVAYKAARRPIAGSGVIDAGFCHGAFGLAHIFNRFYQATREPLFLEATLKWFECGWQMRKPDTGIAGYLFYDTDKNRTLDWRPVPGLLTGITGLGLVTSAALSNHVPDWDRLFLVDLAPQSIA